MSEQEDRIIRIDAVTLATGLSVATINRKEKIGDFPKRLKIGSRAVGWKASSVQAWVENQKGIQTTTPSRSAGPSSASIQGRVKFFCIERGFGFIRHTDGDIFLHASELPDQYHPMPGDLVEYDVKQTRKGSVAIHIRFLSRADKYKNLQSNPHEDIAALSPEVGVEHEQ